MENLGIFYGHMGTLKSIWCILPPFGILCGNLAYIFPLWYFTARRIWQRCIIGDYMTPSVLRSQLTLPVGTTSHCGLELVMNT
jgi:hypothetical protein